LNSPSYVKPLLWTFENSFWIYLIMLIYYHSLTNFSALKSSCMDIILLYRTISKTLLSLTFLFSRYNPLFFSNPKVQVRLQSRKSV
jgi:hypothetical protein